MGRPPVRDRSNVDGEVVLVMLFCDGMLIVIVGTVKEPRDDNNRKDDYDAGLVFTFGR
jgi:hypothetical protein